METVGEVIDCTGKYVFKWRIPNFPSHWLIVDKYYDSPSFSFAGSSWHIRIYPNGEKDVSLGNGVVTNTEGYINLYLWRNSLGSPISLEYSLGLLSEDEKVYPMARCSKVFEKVQGSGTVRLENRSTLVRMMQKEAKDALVVVCEMEQPKSPQIPTSEITEASITHTKSKILQDLKELFLKQENCDAILRVQEQEFTAHKAILTARSPVFSSIFQHDMKEKASGIVDIEDCNPSVFPDFLCFLYCGEVESFSKENVFNLYVVADKYDVSDLKTKCMEFIEENLSVETFCDTINLALKYSEFELVHLATNFFVENAEKLIVTVDWQSFVKENPIQSNELFIKFVTSVKCSNS